MPVHDWTRVNAGIFHHFHQRWIVAISDALNGGRLPPDYYALAEQIAGQVGPDVLTLQIDEPGEDTPRRNSRGLVAVAKAPPSVQHVAATEMGAYVRKQSRVVIHHSSGDRIVALIEIVSPGNKASRNALRAFVQKAADALYHGYHLLLLDLLPAGPRDPNGIHGAVWAEIEDDGYTRPADKPLTLAAYDAGEPKMAYVQPLAVGEALPEMPLFLQPGYYIPVPLEMTYATAWQSVPQRWRRVLEADKA